MHLLQPLILALASAGYASAALGSNATLASVCTASYAKTKLPFDAIQGVTIDASSVTANAYYNYSVSDDVMFPNGEFNYCNVTFAYSHNGRDDQIEVTYWLPEPSAFQNRFLATGGGALAINSGSSSVPGGVLYGASAGLTNGGFGEGFDNDVDAYFPSAPGVPNWDIIYSFGYVSIREMTVLGRVFTQNFFDVNNGTKLYTYYQACSEGGREGFSQVQRFADAYDGAIIGAPAFRYSEQQVNHLFSNVVEQTLNYYPPPCEMDQIVNKTIRACDPLDGKVDGVVSRTDLCLLEVDISDFIGEPYYCAATTGGGGFRKRQEGGSTTPAQNGTITAEAVEVAKIIIGGLKDSQGLQTYVSYQPTAGFVDAETQYNSTTGQWELDLSGLGGEWVYRFLQYQNSSDLPSLDGVTYDTLKGWMLQGLHQYSDSLQVSWPDLTPYHKAGGKVLHFHGESDSSVPTDSSVIYHDAVRQIMYPGMSFNDSNAALNEWYKLFIVPGAAHCTTNDLEENGPWPQTNFQVMIDWVEKGIEPVTLNATHLAGDLLGDNAQICGWPLRPLWVNNGTTMECVYDQKSIDTWLRELPGLEQPVY